MSASSRPHLVDTETNMDIFLKNLIDGKKPNVEKRFRTSGRITPSLKSEISKKINYLTEGCYGYKIGKTGDTYIRTDYSDYRGNYQTMYLLYRSTSMQAVSELEEYYIQKFMKCDSEFCHNKKVKAPGKMMQTYDGYYNLYIVVDH